jgi:peptidyl-tRNA hydrolase
MRPDDIVAMKNELYPLMDITKQNWNRVFNRWLPECQDKILSACANLTALSKKCKSAEQKNAIEIFVSCFKPLEQF